MRAGLIKLQVLGLLVSCVTANFAFGPCYTNMTGMAQANYGAYDGLWYEVFRTSDTSGQWMAACGTQKWATSNGVLTSTNSNWLWYFFFSTFTSTSSVTWLNSKLQGYMPTWFLDFYIN